MVHWGMDIALKMCTHKHGGWAKTEDIPTLAKHQSVFPTWEGASDESDQLIVLFDHMPDNTDQALVAERKGAHEQTKANRIQGKEFTDAFAEINRGHL